MTRALAAATRDNAQYWSHRPADHNARGFFVGGPEEAVPITATLAQSNHCRDATPDPSIARQRIRLARMRAVDPKAERLLRMMAAAYGEPVRNRRRGFVHRAA